MARRILYIQYTNPAGYPPLEHSARSLVAEGWEVLFLGVTIPESQALKFPAEAGLTVRLLPACQPGWRQKLNFAWFILWTLGWAIRWRPTAVYASDALSCPAALAVSGWPVIYHEHDSPGAPPTAFMRFVHWTRRRVARRARLCVLPNQRRATEFAATVGNGTVPVCVWNCPAKREVATLSTDGSGDHLWVLYHGSIVPARLPTTVLTALTMLPEQVRLRAIGYETSGHPGYVRELQAMAEQLGIGHRVEFLGAVPTRAELLDHCRRNHVGLALMPLRSGDLNEQAMTGASNKPFDYLACGLALLVSDLPDWRAMFVEPGYGRACDPAEPASIAASLRWFWENPQDRRAMGERGRERVLQEWNYETQFAPVREVLTREI